MKKEFALNAIAPYFKDPSLCGISDGSKCMYITNGGKMCVAGKYMLPEILESSNRKGSIDHILARASYNQKEVFKSEAVDVLTTDEWKNLQRIHDAIAQKKDLSFKICDLGLFTMEELQEASQKL